jgi:hypothetical protein
MTHSNKLQAALMIGNNFWKMGVTGVKVGAG